MPATEVDRRKLRLLWIGAGTYFLILVNGLRYFASLPYQVVLLGTAINVAMLVTFIVTIRNVRQRIRSSGDTSNQLPAATSIAMSSVTRRNIHVLWGAAVLYFVLMLIGFQYAFRLPYQLLLVGGILNMAIVLTFVVKLRKAYMNRGKQTGV